jgi:methyl-accepting chemotaxis protein
MTHSFRRTSAILILACASLAPTPGRAEPPAKPAAPEGLTAQDKEFLAVANDFARRCGEALERWIANRETTQDKLFAALYYPIPKTNPPKFNTDWDRLADRDILPIEEGVMAKSSVVLFAVLVDRFGYLPTHNQRYSQPLTGNLAVDLLNNRTKRIFNDRTGFAAARSEAPYLIQRYQRDTGEIVADLSVPVSVRGAHWGAVRIGYRQLESSSVKTASQ